MYKISDILASYQFFQDGMANLKEWRVLYNLMDDPPEAAPTFIGTKYAVL